MSVTHLFLFFCLKAPLATAAGEGVVRVGVGRGCAKKRCIFLSFWCFFYLYKQTKEIFVFLIFTLSALPILGF